MKQLTIRGFDKDLVAAIRKLASGEGISLNHATLRLLRAALSGQARPRRVGSSLDAFIGTWTAKQAREISGRLKDFERIDEELWE